MKTLADLCNALEELKTAWNKADMLEVFALFRIDDPAGGLTFYVLAVDPDDEDQMMCIVDSPVSLEVTAVNMKDVFALHDNEGNKARIDPGFRPINAYTLFNKLRKKHGC